MKAFWHKHVRLPFQRALAEVPWFGPVVSALLVTMVVDLLTQAVTAWGGLWLGWGTVALLTLATLAFVYAYTVSESRRRGRGIRGSIFGGRRQRSRSSPGRRERRLS